MSQIVAPNLREPSRSEFLERLSVTHVVVVIAAMIGMHFLSRRLDKDLGGAPGFLVRFPLRRAVYWGAATDVAEPSPPALVSVMIRS